MFFIVLHFCVISNNSALVDTANLTQPHAMKRIVLSGICENWLNAELRIYVGLLSYV